MARRRYQTGCLFKRGKRRKVWVARWREDVLREDGMVGRTLRSVVLGSVSDLPTRRDAQVLMDEELRAVNQGTVRPESSMLFGTFADEQWRTLLLPTLKLCTQHGCKTMLTKRLLPYWRNWRLREIGRQDVEQGVADKFKQQFGWQTVRNAWTLLSGILEAAVEYGYLSMNPARGVKFPAKELKQAPVLITGGDFMKLLKHLDEPYRTMVRLIAVTGLRIGELLAVRWRSLDLEIGTLSVRESVYEGKFQSPKTQNSTRTSSTPRTARQLKRSSANCSQVFPSCRMGPGNSDRLYAGHPTGRRGKGLTRDREGTFR